MTASVRSATTADAVACAEVYAPYVLHGTTSFETEAPGPVVMGQRIGAALERHAWFVAELDDRVVGFAYALDHRSRPAYRWTCETSVYVAAEAQGRGVGRALYEALLVRLTERGHRSAVAVMTLPNPASRRLHLALGFSPVGVLRAAGWKAGRWCDVALLQRHLGDDPHGAAPGEVR